MSLQNEVPCLKVPSGMVPRAALAYLFVPLAIIYGDAIGKGDLEEELKALVAVLKDIRRDIAPDVSAEKNPAKQLALSLVHTIPLVYAQAGYWSVGLRMKTLLNENSKVPSYAATLPEAFHNEVMGYECQRELLGSFSVILLRDVNEDPRVKAKIEVAKRILEPRVRVLREIWATGGSRLAKIFFMLYLCDVTSTYLALLYGVDPSSTETISKIKKASPAGLSVGGTKVIER